MKEMIRSGYQPDDDSWLFILSIVSIKTIDLTNT